jgi:ketosteroid isomerase-like protein
MILIGPPVSPNASMSELPGPIGSHGPACLRHHIAGRATSKEWSAWPMPIISPMSSAQRLASEGMDRNDVHAVIDAFNAAWNAHDLAAALGLCTDDVVFEATNPAPDGRRIEGRAAVAEEWRPIFDQTDGRFESEEIVAVADRVVQRWRYDWGSGHVRGIDLITVRDGKIAEKFSYVKG